MITKKMKTIWANFVHKDYREAFVASRLRTGVAYQIVAMREERGWTQSELADRIGSAQPFISRVESGMVSITLSSAKKFAAAFDVAVELRFIPYSEFVRSAAHGRLDAHVPSFSDDFAPESVEPLNIAMRTVPSVREIKWRPRAALSQAYIPATTPIMCAFQGATNAVQVA